MYVGRPKRRIQTFTVGSWYQQHYHQYHLTRRRTPANTDSDMVDTSNGFSSMCTATDEIQRNILRVIQLTSSKYQKVSEVLR